MSSLPGWMPILLDRINWGCSTSPWFVDLADENKVHERGRRILLDLWPYIRELPINISSVRAILPEHMVAARNLLGQLSDDERKYQTLFKQQFTMAKVTQEELESTPIKDITLDLCAAMSKACQRGTFVEGIHAVVAAELCATMYCRSALPLYENYFERRAAEYGGETVVAEGLAWVRLHAKTHTRHAIWMKRMLCDLEEEQGNEIPEAADQVLNCMLRVWECDPEEAKLPAHCEAACEL